MNTVYANTAKAVLASDAASAIAAAAAITRTVHIRLAAVGSELEASHRLRRAVFCDEQGIFDTDDIDDIDRLAWPIAAVLGAPGASDEVIGTVRIHQSQPGVWYGSRLAVARQARRVGSVGSGLIRLAVGTAHAHGCETFLAHVQSQNVPMFERLHWTSLSTMVVHGRPHHLMQADLAHYPPIHDGVVGFLLTLGAS
ncbi:MAG: histone acetyltransferase [Herbaspirillum sp.]|jgi:putative N-acetyltransferase (TIGR04045 family)|nr:histone acetyltransferase [Herbaspirillum sp.]